MNPTSAIDRQLKRVQEESSSRDMEDRTKKYAPILRHVRRHLNKARAVYYGGMAQNEYLPANARFYAATDLPDYDVFVADPQTVARELADSLRDEGYEYISVRHAFHDNTYKISLDFEDIADITGVSQADVARMRRRAKKLRDGTHLCPLDLVKANAHIELAMPRTAMFRWKKVFGRLKLLEGAHPTSEPGGVVPWRVDPSAAAIVEGLHTFALRAGLPLAGAHAVRFYTGEAPRHDVYVSARRGRVQVLSMDADRTAAELRARARALGAKGLRIVPPAGDSLLAPKRTLLHAASAKGDAEYVLAEVHHVEGQCYGVRRHERAMYASAFYLLYDAYMDMYLTRRTKLQRAIATALLAHLSADDITPECYGNARSMLSAKRSKARKKAPLIFYEPEAR